MFPTVEIPDGDLDRADLSAWLMCPPLNFGIGYLTKFVTQVVQIYPIFTPMYKVYPVMNPVCQVWHGFRPITIFVNEYRYELLVP